MVGENYIKTVHFATGGLSRWKWTGVHFLKTLFSYPSLRAGYIIEPNILQNGPTKIILIATPLGWPSTAFVTD